VAHFEPEYLAHFGPDSVAQFGRNTHLLEQKQAILSFLAVMERFMHQMQLIQQLKTILFLWE
jgi:hypothetical protein